MKIEENLKQMPDGRLVHRYRAFRDGVYNNGTWSLVDVCRIEE
ncbi:MAG: hypothetical protein AABX71_03095 [Nanoarchaeota archaeon]